MSKIPAYQGTSSPSGKGPMLCPKCLGEMVTVNRNGVHIEQCQTCRGVFLDFGELEHITQLETQMISRQPPVQPGYGQGYGGYDYDDGPHWGQRRGKRYRRGGFGSLFFSS
ncbi:MAG: zf-TFIIB domain-containing protein [Actinomycetaceae bacterium]|nr:zf-TFIIB domain-containing protein [Actinomycetaceae bacterium]